MVVLGTSYELCKIGNNQTTTVGQSLRYGDEAALYIGRYWLTHDWILSKHEPISTVLVT